MTNASVVSPRVVGAVTGRAVEWVLGEVAVSRGEVAMVDGEVALSRGEVAVTDGEMIHDIVNLRLLVLLIFLKLLR